MFNKLRRDHRIPQQSKHGSTVRLCFYIGMALVILGYVFLCVSPEEDMQKTIDRVFIGLGMVVIGAVLWLGAIFFKE